MQKTISRKRKRNKRRKSTASSTGTSSSSASDEDHMNEKEEIQSAKYGIEENRMINLTKNCVNILPCVETSQKERETYKTRCMKVTIDPAPSSLKPIDQTCLPTNASNHGKFDNLLEKESETDHEKNAVNSKLEIESGIEISPDNDLEPAGTCSPDTGF